MAKDKLQRIDDLLVTQGLAPDLVRARALVMEGRVLANEQRLEKPSDMVSASAQIRVKDQTKYVSRGGDKLEGALLDLDLTGKLKDAVVLDVGASTGGFTDCCLAFGAKMVIALDVGTNQLAWKLRKDERVHCVEQCDIRDFDPKSFGKIDWVLADISFNSVARLLPDLRRAAPGEGVHFLVLIKPQFELAKSAVESGGVVKDEALRNKAVAQVDQEFKKLGLKDGRFVDSRVEGQKGNREIFYYARS